AGSGMMCFDAARHQNVLFHPFTGGIPGQTWTWNGAAWAMAATTGPTSAITQLVYNPDRLRVLNLSRRSGIIEPWEWNGATWVQLPNSPLAGSYAMTYDPARHRVAVHGGSDQPLTAIRTWSFDPGAGTWEQRSIGGPWGSTTLNFTFDPGSDRALMDA